MNKIQSLTEEELAKGIVAAFTKAARGESSMEKKETLTQFLTNRLKRSIHAAIGMMIFAVGTYFQIQANFGMSPWNSLNQGLSMHLPITYGQASIAVSVAIIIVDLIMKEPIGLGTIINALIGGIGTDICIALNFLPVQTNFVMQTLFLVVGIAIVSYSQYVYISAGLSCGPRDTMLIGLGKRFPKMSLGTINMAILIAVFVCCLFLGSSIGFGTVIGVFGSGAIMDMVFKTVKFEPKTVVHEGLPETVAAMMRTIKK